MLKQYLENKGEGFHADGAGGVGGGGVDGAGGVSGGGGVDGGGDGGHC